MMKAILFDADGVLTLPEDIFSNTYTKSYGLDYEPFSHFFINEWPDFVTGKRDLRQHIKDNPDLWKWNGTADELLEYWFKSEDIQNNELLEIIKTIRMSGTKCYIATGQEAHRTIYMKNIMFPGLFDNIYSTSDIGFKKNDKRFYEIILEDLNLEAANVMFFDDSESKLIAARSIGIDAQLYTSPQQVEELWQSNKLSN